MRTCWVNIHNNVVVLSDWSSPRGSTWGVWGLDGETRPNESTGAHARACRDTHGGDTNTRTGRGMSVWRSGLMSVDKLWTGLLLILPASQQDKERNTISPSAHSRPASTGREINPDYFDTKPNGLSVLALIHPQLLIRATFLALIRWVIWVTLGPHINEKGQSQDDFLHWQHHNLLLF